MAQRPSALLALRSIGTSTGLWVVVAVPVAAAIAAFALSIWVLATVPTMAGAAILLGAVQGLWFYLDGLPSKSDYNGFLRFGSVSGGLLGALAFPLVLSSANIIVARPTAALFLMAAVAGGVAAGLISAHVLYLPLQSRDSTVGRRVIVGGLILTVLTAIDYRLCWPATAERIAVPELSAQDIAGLRAGSARGSRWTGCYEYRGTTPLRQGGGAGLLKVIQTEGVLKVEQGQDSLLGGVDRNGRFRFGGEVTERMAATATLRILWEGKFRGDSFEFTRRLTVVGGVNSLGSGPLTGTGHLIPCDW